MYVCLCVCVHAHMHTLVGQSYSTPMRVEMMVNEDFTKDNPSNGMCKSNREKNCAESGLSGDFLLVQGNFLDAGDLEAGVRDRLAKRLVVHGL